MPRLAYLTLFPLVLSLGFVVVYPVGYSLFLSLTTKGGAFAGLSNYVQMAQNIDFWNSLGVSLLYSSGSTALALGLGLGFTFLLMQAPRGKGIFESIFIVPLAVSPIVVGVLWSPSAIWDDINSFVHFIMGLPYINVVSPFFFFPSMMVSDAWEWAPLLMLIGLSIARSVKREVYEAASLHGATAWQVFRRITLPIILRSPVMGFVLILRFVDAMRAFEIPYAWSSWVGFQQTVGSPVDTLSLYLYKLMFSPIYGFPSSYISAVAISLLVVTLVGATFLLRLLRALGGIT